jgi:transposase
MLVFSCMFTQRGQESSKHLTDHAALTEDQVRRLERAYLQATDVQFRDRLQIVRLAHRGRKHKDIAADLGITPRTVQNWLNADRAGGIDALRPRKAKGAEAKIPAALAAEVRRWVIEGPAGQGLDRANWTHAELAEHLYRTRGLRASRSAMQRFCSRQGIRPYRPTYDFLRGDPVKQAHRPALGPGLSEGITGGTCSRAEGDSRSDESRGRLHQT